MSSLRGQTLTCFYCGSWSVQKKSRNLRIWRCEKCEAENHLDIHGNITEPPATASATPKQSIRYASPVRGPSLPAAPFADEVFCQICIKNQNIVNEILSSYIPDEDSPDYEKYVNSYDTYRAELETRYPQVCAVCAPRAREKIKRAGYVAKTDHLRRMIDLTKKRGVVEPTPGSWKKLVIQLGGWGWWSGPILQSLWHSLSIASFMGIHGHGPVQHCVTYSDAFSDDTMTRCMGELRTAELFTTPCARALEPFIALSFVVAVLTCWWNNKLLARKFQAGARLLHIKQHFLFQLALLSLRLTTFYILTTFSRSLESGEKIGGHAISAALIVIFSLVSLSIIKIDNAPRILFHAEDDQILPDVPQLQQCQAQSIPQIFKSRSSDQQTTPFPFHKLASPMIELPPPQAAPSRHRIPTPPPEPEPVYYPEEMDVDVNPPSPAQQAAYNLRPRAMPQPVQNAGQSPFQTRILPATVPPAYKLRNPNFNQSSNPFTRAHQSLDNAFSSFNASNMHSRVNQPRFRGRASSVTTDDSSAADQRESRDVVEDTDAWGLPIINEAPRRPGHAEIQMAPPRFFAQQDRNDTGLEGMFQTAFRLGDTPKAEKISTSVQTPVAQPFQVLPRGLSGSFIIGTTGGEGDDGDIAAEDEQSSQWKDVLLLVAVGATLFGIGFAVNKVQS